MDIEFTTDKRTLLVMMIGLAPLEHYRSLSFRFGLQQRTSLQNAQWQCFREDLARGELEKETSNGRCTVRQQSKGRKEGRNLRTLLKGRTQD